MAKKTQKLNLEYVGDAMGKMVYQVLPPTAAPEEALKERERSEGMANALDSMLESIKKLSALLDKQKNENGQKEP